MFEFSQNTEMESLDSVPENFRVFYKQSDSGEGYRLNSDDPATSAAVSTITGLAKSLKAARADADSYRKQRTDLSALSEYGDSPEAIAESFRGKLGDLEKQISEGSQAKVDIERIREDLSKSHSKELEKRDTLVQSLKDQLYSNLVLSEATTAIAAQKGVAELLMPFVRERVRAVEEDGNLRVYVVDNEGNRRYSGTTGEAMSIQELVSEMKGNAQFGRLFESEAPSGTGTNPAPQRRSVTPAAEMTSVDKIAAGLRKGQFSRPGQ
jgi:hypothetical protein